MAAEKRKYEKDGHPVCRQYDDIIGLARHVSATHPSMTPDERAAQFVAFDALAGYGDAVRESARLTEEKAKLSEDAEEEINPLPF